MQIEKEEVKILLFAGNILYTRDSKNSTGQLLKLINTVVKVFVYKINSNIPIYFLYTNEKMDRENRDAKPFVIVSSNINILGQL